MQDKVFLISDIQMPVVNGVWINYAVDLWSDELIHYTFFVLST